MFNRGPFPENDGICEVWSLCREMEACQLVFACAGLSFLSNGALATEIFS